MESALNPPVPCGPIDPYLESQYNLRLRHPERTAIYERCAQKSAAFRAAAAGFAELRYGSGPRSVLDFFSAGDAAAPLFVFVHGGYWRALDRGIFSFLAQPWLARGAHVALIGYDLAPAVTVPAIVDEVRAAMRMLRNEAARLRIDIDRVVVGGHSAGAQLGACVLEDGAGWHARGFVGISGVYDLAPLLSTTVNADTRMSAAQAAALSPMQRPAARATRHLCAVGAGETDGFRGQSRAYAAYLRGEQCAVRLLEVPGRNHFDILDDLADAGHELFRQSWALMDAAPD